MKFMNSFGLIRFLKQKIRAFFPQSNTTSEYRLAKVYRVHLVSAKRLLKDIILITIGIFSASFGFKGFLLTNHFIDGGATGISLLISFLTDIPLYVLIITINIPFIIMGYNIIAFYSNEHILYTNKYKF